MLEYKNKISEINEDTVLVRIFSTTDNADTGYWENLCEQLNSSVKTFSRNYIWHKDEFMLYTPILQENTDDMPMHLISMVSFGDNIEDEWFIVYLVMEISKRHKDVIVQIIDSDGDFLLIEAANCLPSWANPDSTENRVFIFNSAVHIIPPNLLDLKNEVNMKDALQIIKRIPEQTKVSASMQEAINIRVGQYPEKMIENFHRAIVNLPLDVAALLTFQPNLIAPIVSTYCNHDAIDAKSCRNLPYKDYIPVEVKFTKCLYAMLTHSKLLKNVKHNFTTEKHKQDILGIKLTCGFQMIMSQLTKDIFCTKEYTKFEKNLRDNGYFKGNIEGSVDYNRLLDKARKYFLDIECPVNTFVAKKISDMMATHDFSECKENFKHNIIENILTEDSDDWLSIHPDQLNDLLSNRYGNKVKFEKDDVITPEAVTSKITDFLKQSSDFEGIDSNKIDDTENDTIDFDADQFVNCLEKMMNFLSSDMNEIDLHDDSDSEHEPNMSDEDINDTELDKELSKKLNSFEESRSNSKSVMFNLTQSIKEEGLSGPSSNLLSTVGVNKTDLLDSDDD